MLGNRASNEALDRKIQQMKLPLAPLVQLTTGHAHPEFPPTLLHYWLLTDDTIDSLAEFYHQTTVNGWRSHYPKSMNWRENLTLEEKRRKWGRFIGLRGCDSPVDSHYAVQTEEQIWEEARKHREERRESESEMWRRKMGRY